MTVTRREFGKTSLIAVATAAIAPTMLLEGCSSTNVTALINTVIASVEAILKITNPSDPWAAELEKALVALQSAETAWNAGSTSAIIISALDTLEAVLAVIPVTAPYSPLIDVLVAAIEAVMAALPAALKALSKMKLQTNPHYGRIVLTKPRLLETRYGAFKKQWNAVVKALQAQFAGQKSVNTINWQKALL